MMKVEKLLLAKTKNVPTLEAGKIAEVPVTFNPTKDGMFDFYAVVELEGDQEHSNDKTAVTRIKSKSRRNYTMD